MVGSDKVWLISTLERGVRYPEAAPRGDRKHLEKQTTRPLQGPLKETATAASASAAREERAGRPPQGPSQTFERPSKKTFERTFGSTFRKELLLLQLLLQLLLLLLLLPGKSQQEGFSKALKRSLKDL